jgi:aminocarboxymuconate-semialdehyde decarboxylase
MWFDTLTYDERSLRFLIDLVGSSGVVVGTDYPFVVQDENPVATIGAVCSGQDELTMLSSTNARAFLALR